MLIQRKDLLDGPDRAHRRAKALRQPQTNGFSFVSGNHVRVSPSTRTSGDGVGEEPYVCVRGVGDVRCGRTASCRIDMCNSLTSASQSRIMRRNMTQCFGEKLAPIMSDEFDAKLGLCIASSSPVVPATGCWQLASLKRGRIMSLGGKMIHVANQSV